MYDAAIPIRLHNGFFNGLRFHLRTVWMLVDAFIVCEEEEAI